MNCKSAAKLFSEHIEGTLDVERSERLHDHLERCSDCAELIEIMELNIVQLENTPEPSMPAGLGLRLAAIPQHELVREREGQTGKPAGGHWLFSNAMAAGILAVFIAANLTWFNPGFQDSIHGCRKLISDKSSRALELASDWGAGLNDLKEEVESRMEVVQDAAGQSGKDTDDAGSDRSAELVSEIIRALGLIGA